MGQISIGEKNESKDHQFIQDESIIYSTDKIMIYTKDFISNLTNGQHNARNSILVDKLDVISIQSNNFTSCINIKYNLYIL